MDRCNKCGAPIENGKCTYCGAIVQTNVNQSIGQQTFTQTSYQQPFNSVNKQDNNGSKSKLITLVLAVFFGYFGAHYFYTGRIGMGILYLFTVGLFCIGWIFDIIRIAKGQFKDSSGLYLQ